MKIGLSIGPIIPIVENIQEFLETIFAELVDLKHIEVHAEDLDDFTILLLNLTKRFKIKFSVHCSHIFSKNKTNFCSANQKDIKKADLWLKKSIKYSKKLKAKYIIIHPDIPKSCSKEKALDILENHIKKNLKYLTKNQKILIENMPDKRYTLSTPSEFKNFLKRFKKQVGICWDVGHEIARFKKQDFTFLKELKNKIYEIHLSSVKKFKDHYPLTQGNLKLGQLIELLKKSNYKGTIIFEFITKNPLDVIESKKEIDRFL